LIASNVAGLACAMIATSSRSMTLAGGRANAAAVASTMSSRVVGVLTDHPHGIGEGQPYADFPHRASYESADSDIEHSRSYPKVRVELCPGHLQDGGRTRRREVCV
jgi:hypothetical protein